METKHCPNCSAPIEYDANMCSHCGWRPYHGKQLTGVKLYPLAEQNFRQAGIVSITLAFLIAVLCTSPFWIREGDMHRTTFVALFSCNVLMVITLTFIQMNMLRKYLLNFYHPRDNIFSNIGWIKVCIVVMLLAIFISILLPQMKPGIENGIFSLLLGLYILWAFLQILTGYSLMKADQYDYVGGVSTLGFILLLSGLIFPLTVLVPFFVANIFFRANRYDKVSEKTDKQSP